MIVNNKFEKIVDDAFYQIRHVKPELQSQYLARILSSKGLILPEQTGYWVDKPIAGYCDVICSECHTVFSANSGQWKFCPECGARMTERN